MLPRCSHITRKRGVFYYRRSIPKTPNGEVVLSLRTRVFRVAECLADGLDQEFRKLIQGVTTDDKTDQGLFQKYSRLPIALCTLSDAENDGLGMMVTIALALCQSPTL
jgi:hypothetical protein